MSSNDGFKTATIRQGGTADKQLRYGKGALQTNSYDTARGHCRQTATIRQRGTADKQLRYGKGALQTNTHPAALLTEAPL